MRDTRSTLMADTVVRPGVGVGVGGWFLMNKQSSGYASSAEFFKEIESIPKIYRVRLGDFGKDKHGPFIRVIRTEKEK